MNQTFLYSLLLETTVPVGPENMHKAVVERMGASDLPPLNLVSKLDVTPVPTDPDASGIQAAALVEIVNLKARVAELERDVERLQDERNNMMEGHSG